MTNSTIKALAFDVFGTVVDYERATGGLGAVCRCLACPLSSLDGPCHAR